MIKSALSLIFTLSFTVHFFAQDLHVTPHDKDANQTATYAETIAFFENMASEYPALKLESHGMTDAGYPLHLAILSRDQTFDAKSARAAGKNIVMINNAIHAGEACGVDATMGLFRDLLLQPEQYPSLENTVLIAIPIYNIGGALNRNSHTRTNQNGPAQYGFRGNAKNLDLNRDFIKCDSKNAATFNQIFQAWQPDVFIDNHTSNGADYQYTMTLIPTQAEKLGGPLAEFQKEKMLPFLFDEMKRRNWEMTPYVFARSTPDEGIAGFLDLPRYSSGYAALWQCLSFMPETHMLKPFEDRVQSTRAFSLSVLEFVAKYGKEMRAVRSAAQQHIADQDAMAVQWSMNTDQVDSFFFKGFTAKYKPSLISGKDRLYYDRNAPYQKWIPWYNTYQVSHEVEVPRGYIIPRAYDEVVDRLLWNGVDIDILPNDTVIEVEMYRIIDFKSSEQPYEGHYLHRNVVVERERKQWQYYAGDFYVRAEQPSKRYLVETLEPMGPDSFFAWNFFDGILMQKEYFSAYVFEDLAVEILEERPSLKAELEIKKKQEPEFAEDAYAQLNFIYKHSPHHESTYRLYPIGRVR